MLALVAGPLHVPEPGPRPSALATLIDIDAFLADVVVLLVMPTNTHKLCSRQVAGGSRRGGGYKEAGGGKRQEVEERRRQQAAGCRLPACVAKTDKCFN